jgi:hypothetical protein
LTTNGEWASGAAASFSKISIVSLKPLQSTSPLRIA